MKGPTTTTEKAGKEKPLHQGIQGRLSHYTREGPALKQRRAQPLQQGRQGRPSHYSRKGQATTAVKAGKAKPLQKI